MTIPDFQTIMRPLLEDLKDGERSNKETLEALANHFNLNEEERLKLLPSGRAPLFYNRIAWAKVHLKGAGLIEAPRRGFYRLTVRGHETLRDAAKRIDMAYLKRFAEYQDFRTPKGEESSREGEAGAASENLLVERDELTPEEHLEYGHQRMREGLAADLLRRVKDGSPAFFERLVVELLIALGYGGSREDAGRTVGRSGDGGVDGMINEDRLGLDVIYVQAKRWDGTVGRPEIQKFAGALQGQRARKGVFITTSDYSRDAREYAEKIETRIVLINGPRLAELMIDHGIGVTSVASYQVKRVDSDYFDES